MKARLLTKNSKAELSTNQKNDKPPLIQAKLNQGDGSASDNYSKHSSSLPKRDESRIDLEVIDGAKATRAADEDASSQQTSPSRAKCLGWGCGSREDVDDFSMQSSETGETAKVEQQSKEESTNKKLDKEDKLTSNLREADRRFMNGQLDEALIFYRGSIAEAKKRTKHGDQTAGDINVMMSTIWQGKNEPASAIKCLIEAKSIFKQISKGKSIPEASKATLGQKLIEVNTCLANLYAETGKMKDASSAYKDAIETYDRHFSTFTQLQANLYNNYAYFLSNCLEDHKTALSLHQKAFDAQKKNNSINADCATTLNHMGRTFMRQMETRKGQDRKKSVKKAIFCFEQALRIYRLSLVKNDSEKILQTVFLLNMAREAENEQEIDSSNDGTKSSGSGDKWEYYEEMTVVGDLTVTGGPDGSDIHSRTGNTISTNDNSENTFDVAKRLMFQCYECTHCKGYPWY